MKSASLTTPADFHSHILPSVDDGSKNVQMTRGMLDMMAAQGIRRVVATPHFYPFKDSIENFLSRRARAAEELLGVYDETVHPRVYLGAEVAYYSHISRSDSMRSLCLSGTKYLLLEMPFTRWTEEMTDDILAFGDELGIHPILAHIERYIRFQKRKTIPYLIENGVLIQSNASFFLERGTAKKALRMLSDGEIHLLGSDCHNLNERRPNLGEAVREIGACAGLSHVCELGDRILSRAQPIK